MLSSGQAGKKIKTTNDKGIYRYFLLNATELFICTYMMIALIAKKLSIPSLDAIYT